MSELLRRLFPREISRGQERNAGLGLALAALIAGRYSGRAVLIDLSIALLLLALAVPGALRPITRGWIGVTRFLGAVLSLALLCLSFAILVIPIGLARRIAGADELQLRKWRKGTSSVFTPRHGMFSARDLERPY